MTPREIAEKLHDHYCVPECRWHDKPGTLLAGETEIHEAITEATKALREENERLGQRVRNLEGIKKIDESNLARAESANKALVEALRQGWLIWSNEHAAWWNPERLGYTQRIEKAGRYSLEEAETCAEMRSPAAIPPEVVVPSPELRAALAAHEEAGK